MAGLVCYKISTIADRDSTQFDECKGCVPSNVLFLLFYMQTYFEESFLVLRAYYQSMTLF